MVAKPVVQRRRFTAREYHRMGKAGVFHPDDRVELIDGEIVVMAPMNDPHAAVIIRLTEVCIVGLAGQARVSAQLPVRLSRNSEPEPDLVIFRPSPDRPLGAPRPEEILLLVEVSDTTLAYDRGIKLRLYAMAGIPETWIWDLKRRQVLRFRDPEGEHYRMHDVITSGTIVPAALPGLAIDIDAILA